MGMSFVQTLTEVFYFPFYFVSLNVAGFLSFVRFVKGNQPPGWEKGDRVAQVQLHYEAAEEGENSYKDEEGLDYPKVSSGSMR